MTKKELQRLVEKKRYHVKIGKRVVPVDWIVRDDTARKFYTQALKEAYRLPRGLPIVTPEWLIILKYIAGRFKDQQDAVYLLKQKGLVDRRVIRRRIIATAGREFWALIAAGLRRCMTSRTAASPPRRKTTSRATVGKPGEISGRREEQPAKRVTE